MKKNNLLEEYMKKVEEEGLKNGITFDHTIKNDEGEQPVTDNATPDLDYMRQLETEGMMSEDIFGEFEKKFNIDWNHIRKVSEVSETKYGDEYMKKNNRTIQDVLDEARNLK